MADRYTRISQLQLSSGHEGDNQRRAKDETEKHQGDGGYRPRKAAPLAPERLLNGAARTGLDLVLVVWPIATSGQFYGLRQHTRRAAPN